MDWIEWIFTAILSALVVIQFIWYVRFAEKCIEIKEELKKLKESENND